MMPIRINATVTTGPRRRNNSFNHEKHQKFEKHRRGRVERSQNNYQIKTRREQYPPKPGAFEKIQSTRESLKTGKKKIAQTCWNKAPLSIKIRETVADRLGRAIKDGRVSIRSRRVVTFANDSGDLPSPRASQVILYNPKEAPTKIKSDIDSSVQKEKEDAEAFKALLSKSNGRRGKGKGRRWADMADSDSDDDSDDE